MSEGKIGIHKICQRDITVEIHNVKQKDQNSPERHCCGGSQCLGERLKSTRDITVEVHNVKQKDQNPPEGHHCGGSQCQTEGPKSARERLL